MGMRLDGAALAHRDAARARSSPTTVPGSIQVPGNGLPIVLLADGQTAGGYPKIATVVSADLPRLALRRPGDCVRFELVTVSEAESLARAAETSPGPSPASRRSATTVSTSRRSTPEISSAAWSTPVTRLDARVIQGHGEPSMQPNLNADLVNPFAPGRWATMRRCWRSSIRPTSPAASMPATRW